MDVMKIESKFTTGILARVIKRTVKKQFGYDIDLNIKSVRVKIDDDMANAHLELDARMPKETLSDIVDKIS